MNKYVPSYVIKHFTGRCKEGNEACEATKATVLETMEDICQEIKSLGIVLVRDEERALAFKGCM